MIQLQDGSESQDKLDMLYGGLQGQHFCPQDDNDLVTLNNFFVICRDIIGINTFEFDEEEYVPDQEVEVELEMEAYENDNQSYAPTEAAGTPQPSLIMSAI